MIEKHRDVFFKVAEDKKCWIAVREPNVLGEEWHNKSGYIPKPVTCKAKTADNPAFAYAGLVVDPTMRPEAFLLARLKEAEETWEKKFLVGGKLPDGFTRIEQGAARGVVKYRNSAIFPDYDLLAILPSNGQGERMPVDDVDAERLEREVLPLLKKAFINDCNLADSMVQHGADFNYDRDVTWRADEQIQWFGPGRRSDVQRTPQRTTEH